MRRTILMLAVLVAGAPSLGVGVTLASAGTGSAKGPQASAVTAPQAGKAIELHGITGKVVAVDPDTKTLVVKGSVVGDQMDKTISATITDTSNIRHGWFHRNLSDLKVGEQVRMVYQGTAYRWVADHIRILDPLVAVKGIEGPDVRT